MGGTGGGGTLTGYAYQAAVVIGICEGPVTGMLSVWSGKTRQSMADAGLGLRVGNPADPPWGHLTAHHQPEALGYSGLCCATHQSLSLGTGGNLPTLSFEVFGQGAWEGTQDALPTFILTDFLSNVYYGAGWPAAQIGDLTAWDTYCKAAGLLLSPAITEQSAAVDFLKLLAQCTNSEFLWSQGKLTVIPYADATITGSGVTFTPNLTPVYDLNEDDFLVDNTGDDPVTIARITSADAWNHIQVEFCNRAKDYNVEIAEAKDQADIEAKGLRTRDPITLHAICDATIARTVAQLILQRTLFIRNTYTFKLGWKHALLEPLDLVTLTAAGTGLDFTPAKITRIEEDEDGALTITAEEYPFGVSSHSLYPHQQGAGYVPDYNVAPGNPNQPVIFEPPARLTAQYGLEVWAALSGGENWGGCELWASTDGVNYQLITTVRGWCRTGRLAGTLPDATGLDTTNTMTVDVTESRAQILSATQEAFDAQQSLCYVDGELLAYRDATLTGPYWYNLTHLQRGCYGSATGAHSVNSRFARLDDAVIRYPFSRDLIGANVYFKFPAFNKYGGGHQSLADVPVYTYQVTGNALRTPIANVTGLDSYFTGTTMSLRWTPVSDFRPIWYEVRLGDDYNKAMILGTTTTNEFPVVSDGTYWVSAVSDYARSAAPASVLLAGTVLVANVVQSYDEAATGWSGTLSGATEIDIAGRLWLANIAGVVQTPGYYEIPAGHVVNIGSNQICQLSANYNALSDSPLNMFDDFTDFDAVANLDGDFSGFSNVAVEVAIYDGSAWGDWRPFMPGPYYGAAFKFRLVFTSWRQDVTAVCSAFSFTADMPDRIETFTAQAIGTGGQGFTYAHAFQTTPNVQVTVLNPQTGDYALVTGATVSGCTVQVFNGGSGVARTVNVLAQGY